MIENTRVELIPIFDDNYVFILIDPQTSQTLIIDPGEAHSTLQFLQENQLQPLGILLTHHHHDHILGAQEIKAKFPCPIYAPEKNKKQIPFADKYVHEGQNLQLGAWSFNVLELPGHTLGHVAYFEEQRKWIFSGDVLFGLGCGRLFEGSYAEAFKSLERIKELPAETLIYCTHEYTERNLEFCRKLNPQDNTPIYGNSKALDSYAQDLKQKRSLKKPSVPLKLISELSANPFLLAKNVEQFTYLRELRNRQ